MRSNVYLSLAERSGELSEEFYRCVSQWARQASAETADECEKTAREYEKALKAQIRYLKTKAKTGPRDEAIKSCEMYLKMIDAQLKLLKKRKRGH